MRRSAGVATSARTLLATLLVLAGCGADERASSPRRKKDVDTVADDAVTMRALPLARPPWGAEPAGAMRVTSMSLEAQRTAGDPNIQPDEPTKKALLRAGTRRAITPVKLCVNEGGAVVYVHILKSSGAAQYDEQIETAVRSTWRFRSLLVDRVPVRACSEVVFTYVDKNSGPGDAPDRNP